DVFANRFRPVATPLHGLRLAQQVEDAEHAYSVAIVTPRGPWIARISLRAMAEVLG
ncbi:MAG: hypothetical protein JO370_04610, partial [Paucibacter sp.]|nr:hypothetical protein [Roseateles sp.]